jgi:putative membrane protein
MLAMRFLTTSVITAVAVWFTSIIPFFHIAVEGGTGAWWKRALVFLLVGAIMAALNGIVKPIVDALTLPIRILTLGLFSLVIGWFILWLSAWITDKLPWATLTIGGFWPTLWAALVIAIAVGILSAIVPGARRR